MRSKTNKILFVVFLGIVFVLVILSVVSFEEAYHQYLSGDDILYVSTRIVDGKNIELWTKDRAGNPLKDIRQINAITGECYLDGRASYVFNYDNNLVEVCSGCREVALFAAPIVQLTIAKARAQTTRPIQA